MKIESKEPALAEPYSTHNKDLAKTTTRFTPTTRRRAHSPGSSLPKTTIYFIIMITFLFASIVVAIAVGSVDIAPGVVIRVLLSHVLPASWIDVNNISDS